MLVAEVGGEVVGFIHFGPSTENEEVGEVYGLYVHPSSWGTGAAQALNGQGRGVAVGIIRLSDPLDPLRGRSGPQLLQQSWMDRYGKSACGDSLGWPGLAGRGVRTDPRSA